MNHWTPERLYFVKKWRPRLTRKGLAQLVSCAFDIDVSESAIKGVCANHKLGNYRENNGQFKKGHTGFRPPKGSRYSKKTEFKPGNRPQNAVPIGTEVIENVDGYVRVKIGEPNQWKYKHVIAWEKEHGQKPKSTAIIFLDGNRQNCAIENLYLVTRGELAVLNKKYSLSKAASPEVRRSLIALVRLEMTTRKHKSRNTAPKSAGFFKTN